MYPVLLQFGSVQFYSYGILLSIGFLAALWLCSKETERLGVNQDRFYDLAVLLILSSIIGARLYHVLAHWSEFAGNPWEIFYLWNGGLAFYGGLLAATVTGGLFLRKHKIPFLPVADIAAVGIPLGLAFGRLGCTLAGCCYGKPTSWALSITFTDPRSLAPLNIPLHPVQIYEALSGIVLAGFLYLTRNRFRTPGMQFWTMLILYGILRCIFEALRNDPRGFAGPFPVSMLFSFALIAYAAGSIIHARWRAAASPDA